MLHRLFRTEVLQQSTGVMASWPHRLTASSPALLGKLARRLGRWEGLAVICASVFFGRDSVAIEDGH